MKKIETMVCKLMDEACGALEYAEKYMWYKNTHPDWASTYADMASEEITHVDRLHTIFQQRIDEVSWMPEEAKHEWESCVNKATEKIAMARLILTK